MIDILIMTGTLSQSSNPAPTETVINVFIGPMPGGRPRVLIPITITIPKRRTSYFA